MTGDVRARARWAIGVGLVLVVLASVVIWSANRPVLRGDVAWQVPVEELGFAPDARVLVSAVAGDLVALESSDGSAVVDASGDPVLTDLPGYAWVLREDGSGWGGAVDDEDSRNLVLVGWDDAGQETFRFDAARDVEDLLAAEGVRLAGPGPGPEVGVIGRTDDVVAISGCDDRQWLRFGLDVRSGEIVWSDAGQERCVQVGRGDRRSEVFLDPIAIGTETVSHVDRVLDVETGAEVRSLPDGLLAPTIVQDALYWWDGEGVLHRVDPRTGDVLWRGPVCEEPQGLDVTPLRGADSGIVVARCRGVRWLVDEENGEARELDQGARVSGYQPTPDGDRPEYDRPVLGEVLLERSGETVVASDPLTGSQLWDHDLGDVGDGVVVLRSEAGVHATAVVRVLHAEREPSPGDLSVGEPSWPPGTEVATDLVVLDARTAEVLAEVEGDDAQWDVMASDDGSSLLSRTLDGRTTLFLVGRR